MSAPAKLPPAAKGYFVTGTDTGVGKTWVTLGIMQALQSQGRTVVGMKPVASGAQQTPEGLRNEDALLIQARGNQPLPYSLVNPYCFEPPLAPHLAAQREGVEISIDCVLEGRAALAAKAEYVVVEGVGGWRVPLNPRGEKVSDLALRLGYPVILVVGLRLGCINHTLLTDEAIVRDGANFAGWIGSQIDPEYVTVTETLETLASDLPVPMLGYIPWLASRDDVRIAACLHNFPI
jgi:dethiobiotin synthetase